MARRSHLLAVVFLVLAAGCSPSRVEVAEEALAALEAGGVEGLLPYVTRDSRTLLETLPPEAFGAGGGGGTIQCEEAGGGPDGTWSLVRCSQGEQSVRLVLVDTGRGPRIDLLRWSPDPLADPEGNRPEIEGTP
ncbi:MAG: hypothetical protein FJ098_02330 [Deltaproteobacteria bacterium]|nr:hypothetical protein [Deltaproteobacteria bacterium]